MVTSRGEGPRMLPGRGVLACLLSLLVTPGANALLAATVMQQSTEQQQPPKQPSQQGKPPRNSSFRLPPCGRYPCKTATHAGVILQGYKGRRSSRVRDC